MTTLQVSTARTGRATLWLLLVGIGSGMFNSPNTAAMMGTVPAHRRGIAAGARTMLQNTGAVISIAFVLAIVTAAVPKDVLFQIFSGLASGLSRGEARSVHPQHAHGALGPRRDVVRRRGRVAPSPAPLARREEPSRAPRSGPRPRRSPHERPRRPRGDPSHRRRRPRSRARLRGRSATTRRSACCPRPRAGRAAPTAPTGRRTSSASGRCCGSRSCSVSRSRS